MDDFCFIFKVGQTSLFEGLHPFFERMLSSSFEEVEGIVRISFPPREKEVSSSRLRGKRSSLLSRYLGGACLFFY